MYSCLMLFTTWYGLTICMSEMHAEYQTINFHNVCKMHKTPAELSMKRTAFFKIGGVHKLHQPLWWSSI